MRAAVLKDIGKIKIEEVKKPVCFEDSIIIEVKACNICSTDVKIYRYGYSSIKFPLILGHELAGVIAEIGKNVRGYKEGDKIALAPNISCGECYYCTRGMQTACDNLRIIGIHSNGGFAEYVLIPNLAIQQDCVNIIPGNVSFEEAALIDPIGCAINACELSKIKLGDTVVVIGAGPTGCLNVEICKDAGAEKIILVQRSIERLNKAKFTGADVYISPLKEDVIQRVKEETKGRGADVVIVACPSAEAQKQAIEMVAKRGSVNFFGGLPKDNPFVSLNNNLIHYKECSVVGTHGCSSRHCQLALQLIASKKIRSSKYITHRLSLVNFLEGINIAESKRGLKVAIIP